jgi:hypothetical protein
MSAQASIEIRFSTFYQDETITQLIQMLLDGEWTFNDANISQTKLMKILQEKEQKKETIEVLLTWQNTNFGGTFTFQSKEKLFINLTPNRKTMQGQYDTRMTDSNWYLMRILPIFHEKNIDVYYFQFSELA